MQPNRVSYFLGTPLSSNSGRGLKESLAIARGDLLITANRQKDQVKENDRTRRMGAVVGCRSDLRAGWCYVHG